MADEQASAPFCIQCGYNLTGLTGDICPECGGQIDWALAALDEEGRRPGTPAHRARGWRLVVATLQTVLLMLFAPWRFAKQLRNDESLLPALWTALVSFAILVVAVLGILGSDHFKDLASYFTALGSAAVAVVLCQSLCFSTLHYNRLCHRTPWFSRFRMWLIVSLYSTCFVSTWPIVQGPPYAGFSGASFYIPFLKQPGNYFGPQYDVRVTIITYWWWAILAVMLVVRNRPRWLALASIPFVYAFIVFGTIVYAVVMHVLHLLA